MKYVFLVAMTLMLSSGKTIYEYNMKDIDGKEVSLSSYKGKVLLVVNVASKCGNTPQYKDIEALYEKYKDKGLVVLGFPANNFMEQEPGTDGEIKTFCSSQYHVSFPMFSKISVKGSDMNPLYKFLTNKALNGVIEAPVKWNFQKFLISKDGHVVTSIAPGKSVNDPDVIKALEKELGS